MEKILKLFCLALVMSMATTVMWWREAHEATSDNATLRVEIAEWQRAATPALVARGWQSDIPTSKLVPRDLREALNPCMPAATSVTNIEYHPTACESLDGFTHIVIMLKSVK